MQWSLQACMSTRDNPDLAMAPPKAVVAGGVCITFADILWQGLQVAGGLRVLFKLPQFS